MGLHGFSGANSARIGCRADLRGFEGLLGGVLRMWCRTTPSPHVGTTRSARRMPACRAGQILKADGPHGPAEAATDAARAAVARTEVQVVRAGRIVRAERAGPVVAVGTNVVEVRAAEEPRRGEKNVIAFIAGFLADYLVTVHAVFHGPRPDAVATVTKFIKFSLSWHAPVTAPVHVGDIVLGVKDGLAIGEANKTIRAIVAVFGHGGGAAFAVLVGGPPVAAGLAGLPTGRIL